MKMHKNSESIVSYGYLLSESFRKTLSKFANVVLYQVASTICSM